MSRPMVGLSASRAFAGGKNGALDNIKTLLIHGGFPSTTRAPLTPRPMLARPFFSAYTLALAGLIHLDLSAARPLSNNPRPLSNTAKPLSSEDADTEHDGLASPLGMAFHAMSKRTTGRKTHIKNRRTFSPTTSDDGHGHGEWQLYHRRQVR